MDIHLEEQQARQQTVVNVSSGLWVVDSGPRGGAVRILSIDAASVAHGNATLTFVVRNELFSADWLGGVTVTASPSSAADPAAVLEVSRAVAPVRVYHDEGWGAGWAAVVQPSMASVHLRHTEEVEEKEKPTRATSHAGPSWCTSRCPAFSSRVRPCPPPLHPFGCSSTDHALHSRRRCLH
jgi:hypothetical protein